MKEKKTKILFYHSHLSEMGGVETFTYNFCYLFREDFDITLLYCSANRKRLQMMKELVKTTRYKKGKVYNTDIYIRNSVWGIIPENINFKYDIEMRHADYMYLLKLGLLKEQYKSQGIKHVVACSKHVAKMSDEIFGDDPKVLYNPVIPVNNIPKVYHFVSFMRVSKTKGFERMNKFYTMLKESGIPFEWNIFTNTKFKSNVDEIHFWKARQGFKNYVGYLKDADYSVLLSDSEGCPYQVLESLQVGVPVIVTNIPGIREIVRNGLDGYIIPLDMNFNIRKIKHIPKVFYNVNTIKNVVKWKEYLEEIERKIQDE